MKHKNKPARAPGQNTLWQRLAFRMDTRADEQNKAPVSNSFVQAKLTVGAPDDPYEAEAGRMADRVMRMPEPALQRQPS